MCFYILFHYEVGHIGTSIHLNFCYNLVNGFKCGPIYMRLDEYNLKYGRENYTFSRIFDPDISEKNSTSNEVEIKKVTVQYIYLIMSSYPIYW